MPREPLSPEELDLDRSEMSEEDWKARLEQLESDPDLAREIIEQLTEAQKTVLRMSYEKGHTHSGRGGWNVRTMRALERLGCVKAGKEYRWDMNWSLTTRGKSVGRLAQEQWLESFRKNEPKEPTR